MNASSAKNTKHKDFGSKTFLYIDHLYTYALMMTGDDRRAEKLLMKTYEKAFGFWEYLSGETIIELWLFRILMKLYRESNLNVQNTKQEYADVQTPNLTDNDKAILEEKTSFAFTSKIIKNISSLPLEMKEVLVLTNVQNFSYETAADLIDIPEGTVRKRLFDARKFLLIKLLDKKVAIKSEDSSLSAETKKLIIYLTDQKKIDVTGSKDHEEFIPEIELQRIAKMVIQNHLPLQLVRDAVKKRLQKKYAPELKDQLLINDPKERKGLITGATILMFVLIAILIILNGPAIITHQNLADEQSGSDNFFIQLKQNYINNINAKNAPTFFEGDKELIKQFLNSSGVNNEPIFFDIESWEVRKCFITEFDGNKLVNFIYRSTENSELFTYYANLSLLENHTLKLSENLMDYLDSENCFSQREGNLIYLLRNYNGNIWGYVLNIKDKDLIASICRYETQ